MLHAIVVEQLLRLGRRPNQVVALLVLGWAYVLSADLAARQGLLMEYRTSPMPGRSADAIEIDLDYATPDELEWWMAVTRPGVGWSIKGDQAAPWAVQLVEDMELQFAGPKGGIDIGLSQQHPPSAAVAASYLSKVRCLAGQPACQVRFPRAIYVFSMSQVLFGSALWGPFWNPSVLCKYAGAWLAPIAAVLEHFSGINKWSS